MYDRSKPLRFFQGSSCRAANFGPLDHLPHWELVCQSLRADAHMPLGPDMLLNFGSDKICRIIVPDPSGRNTLFYKGYGQIYPQQDKKVTNGPEITLMRLSVLLQVAYSSYLWESGFVVARFQSTACR